MSEAELLEQAHTAMAEMRFEDAVRIYDRILRQNPSCVDAVYSKAEAMSNLQEYEVALHLLDQALRLVDGNSDYFTNILLLKGNTLLELGLIAAQGMSTCHAIRQYDWREVLWEPWVPKGSKFRPEA